MPLRVKESKRLKMLGFRGCVFFVRYGILTVFDLAGFLVWGFAGCRGMAMGIIGSGFVRVLYIVC